MMITLALRDTNADRWAAPVGVAEAAEESVPDAAFAGAETGALEDAGLEDGGAVFICEMSDGTVILDEGLKPPVEVMLPLLAAMTRRVYMMFSAKLCMSVASKLLRSIVEPQLYAAGTPEVMF